MTDLPPPAQPPPSRIPAPLTSFLGRHEEIASLAVLLRRSDVRLLTLTGPGGIGKTRLAWQVVDRISGQFTDGVAFVSLAPVRDPALVLPTIAQALGVPVVKGPSLLEQVTAFPAGRHLLLVLDNAEHVLDAVALLVADLLARCPELTVLATSRGRLNISGEQVIPLPSLDQDTARALFTARAAAGAVVVTSPQTATVIDAICERLDRLPLAIELAAARTTVLSPHALLARLDHRLDLLTGGPRDAPARLRDMRETIAWSHDLLPEPEQMLFRRLGVFASGFTLEAAEAVAGKGSDVLDGVSALVAASLVNPIPGEEDERRFTMLESIRDYALEQLAASGEEAAIRRVHVHYYLALAGHSWTVPTGAEAARELDRQRPEMGNFREALGWTLIHEPVLLARLAGALVDYWVRYNHFTEGRVWVERSLAAAPLPIEIHARALSGAGWLALHQDDLVQAATYTTEAVALAREIGDERQLTFPLFMLGEVMLAHGDLQAAEHTYLEAHALALATGEPRFTTVSTLNLGRVAMVKGDLPRAEAFFEEALALHQLSSGSRGVAYGQLYLGKVLRARGDVTRAAKYFCSALPTFAGIGDWANVASTLEGLTGGATQGCPDSATRLLGAAAAMRDRVGHPRDRDDCPAYERTLATARTALGGVAFVAAWEVGKQLPWDDVLAEVDTLVVSLSDLPDPLPAPRDSHGLSPREREVLRLLVEGRSNRAIADVLSISERTVENHVRHILDKLGLDSRVAAATWSVRHNLA